MSRIGNSPIIVPEGTGTREFFAEVTMVDDLISEIK